MTARNIRKYPDDCLREISRDVETNSIQSPEIQTFVKDLKETLLVENGIGIASPQVGVNLRIIIVDLDENPKVFINPKITKKSRRKLSIEEGCLSIPGIYGVVRRYRSINVEAFDEDGKQLIFKAEGLFAVVLQHEIDHLNGVLFIDHAVRIVKRTKM